jgi:hypothetical protein
MPTSPPAISAIAGIDFTSRPRRAKQITVALGHLQCGVVRLERVDAHASFESFGKWLRTPGPWLGVFDLPFGLPRELVLALGWPTQWLPLMRHYAALGRPQIRDAFKAFCDARPAGAKFAHRATDRPAGSSPSMKWVNPPVAWMLHAGVPLLLDAGLHLPGLHEGDRDRVALEGYPGLLAREIHGARPYKSDESRKQTAERLIARKDIVDALEQGRTRLGLRLKLSHAQRDALDAALCLMQAGWASTRTSYGWPAGVDPLEGWIVSA